MRYPEETGWLIEDAQSEVSAPSYLSGYSEGRPGAWSANHLEAIRFTRKTDAEQAATLIDDGEHEVRICEHSWGGEKVKL